MVDYWNPLYANLVKIIEISATFVLSLKDNFMKRLGFFLIVCFLTLASASAQRISSYVVELGNANTSSGARSRITQDSKSTVAIASASTVPDARVAGFRVCIFFDNSQSARSAAQSALGLFQSTMPSYTGEVQYSNPTFKVLVGDCLTRIEATQLLGRVKGQFPKAFIVNEMISLDRIGKGIEMAVSDSLEVI